MLLARSWDRRLEVRPPAVHRSWIERRSSMEVSFSADPTPSASRSMALVAFACGMEGVVDGYRIACRKGELHGGVQNGFRGRNARLARGGALHCGSPAASGWYGTPTIRYRCFSCVR